MGEFTRVATVEEIPEGTARMVEIGGRKLAVFHVEGEFYAIDNTCTHDGGPLAEGTVDGHEVTCPWHGAVFDVRTGEVLGPPAGKDVASHAVRVQGSDIEVEL